jgi:hypothetical protein
VRLCQGYRTKVFEVAEVIKLGTERKEFGKRTGIAVAHIQDEHRNIVVFIRIKVFTCHQNKYNG